jgi:hypothetical protein
MSLTAQYQVPMARKSTGRAFRIRGRRHRICLAGQQQGGNVAA